jgi:hypothetical protein
MSTSPRGPSTGHHAVNVDGPAGVIRISVCRPGSWEVETGRPVTNAELADPDSGVKATPEERAWLLVTYHKLAKRRKLLKPEELATLPGAAITTSTRTAKRTGMTVKSPFAVIRRPTNPLTQPTTPVDGQGG